MAIAGSSLLTSCDLSVENPNNPTATGFFESQDRFVLNMIAIMNEWRADFDANVMKEAGELRSGIYSGTSIDGSALNDLGLINNSNLTASSPQFTKFAGFYGVIGNLNNFIKQAETNQELFSEEAYNYLRGMAYGMRAYCYFQLFKMNGTVPIRTEPEVFEGNYNNAELYKPRAAASEVLALIKSDIAKSLEGFDAGKTFSDARITGVACNYWTKAATEMLAGETYLWTGKVSTGDVKANPADVATAKTYFNNVVSNYGFAMQNTYPDVFDPTKKGNKEIIFSTYYGYGVATAIWYWYSNWSVNTGQAQGRWWVQRGADGMSLISGANRLGYYVDANGNNARTTWYYQAQNVVNRAQYKNAVFYQFDARDGRRDYQFFPCYMENEDEEGQWFIEDFDIDSHYLAAAFFYKYQGQVYNNSISGVNDMIYYRLPLAYMYLAEIANYEGDNATVERYINMVRQRAFGDNWDASTDAYKAGSFKENEVAILQEKSREFLQEGQRWWDLRRLTAVKGGSDADHLVFQPEGCIGWGLDLATHPMWHEVCNRIVELPENPIETNVPVLDKTTQAHLVLWPISINEVVSAEESPTGQPFDQTPGY